MHFQKMSSGLSLKYPIAYSYNMHADDAAAMALGSQTWVGGSCKYALGTVVLDGDNQVPN